MDDGLWQSVLGEIELSVSRASFATWFKNTELLDTSDGEYKIAVPNIFAKQQLESKFTPLIEETMKKNGATIKSLQFVIGSTSKNGVKKPQAQTTGQLVIERTAATPSPQTTQPSAGINSRYTFESF